MFALNPDLDPVSLGLRFAASRRLQVPDFLSRESAAALYEELARGRAWRLTANRGEQIIDFDAERQAAMTPDHRGKLARAVALGGRYGFQYCYETIRLPAAGGDAKDPADLGLLAALPGFLSSSAVIDFMRALTGDPSIAFADAHASRFQPGHFLTAHDDKAEQMNRRAAYVLNLTPEWRTDWGGLLLFHDTAGNIEQGFTPAFNRLNIFTVPQKHSVSFVTPLAGAPRYAVTGWLRSS